MRDKDNLFNTGNPVFQFGEFAYTFAIDEDYGYVKVTSTFGLSKTYRCKYVNLVGTIEPWNEPLTALFSDWEEYE